MSGFVVALSAALEVWYAPRRLSSPVTSQQGLRARMRALESAYGGPGAAAAAAGAGASSWRAWKAPAGASSHRTPGPANRGRLEAAYDHLMRSQATRKRGRTIKLLSITADVVGDPDRARYRNLIAYRVFNADKVRSWADLTLSWARGDPPEQTAAVALSLIARAYGIPFAFESDDVEVEIT